MKLRFLPMLSGLCGMTAALILAPESARAEMYSCKVTFSFSQTCRYRWYEDLFRNVCGGYTVNRDRNVDVNAESETDACTKAKAAIEDDYPSSYNSSTACRMIRVSGGSRPADARCTETVDMSAARCRCVTGSVSLPADPEETETFVTDAPSTEGNEQAELSLSFQPADSGSLEAAPEEPPSTAPAIEPQESFTQQPLDFHPVDQERSTEATPISSPFVQESTTIYFQAFQDGNFPFLWPEGDLNSSSIESENATEEAF